MLHLNNDYVALKRVCKISNQKGCAGGTILLGVNEDTQEKDNSKRFQITGVDDADKIRKDLWNIVNSREKVNVNLLHDEDVQTIVIDGKSVIVIHVPRAEYNLRPVYINNNPMGCLSSQSAVDAFLSAKAISEKTSEKISVSDRTIENDLAQLKKKGS